jgi:hypothetical protein
LEFWNTFAKHDSLFQKSPILERPFAGNADFSGACDIPVFQNTSNSRRITKVPKFNDRCHGAKAGTLACFTIAG